MNQQVTCLPLSSARLQIQQAALAAVQDDDGFVENQIRDETEQDFERALQAYAGSDHINQRDSTEVLRALVRQQKLRAPSSSTPMRRFCAIGKAHEAIPLAAEQAIGQPTVALASFESMEVRSDAAGIVAGELQIVKNTNSEAVTGERKGPQGNLVSVQKLQRQRIPKSRSLTPLAVDGAH